MGYPSGTFSHAVAGPLEVTFTGEFTASAGGDWGSGNPITLIIKCTVKEGATVKAVAYIQPGTPTATVVLDYPGSSTAWTVAMEYQTHSLSGPSSIQAINLKCACVLIKR